MTEKIAQEEGWDPSAVAAEIGELLMDRGGKEGYLHKDASEIGVGARYEAALTYFRGALSIAFREHPPSQAPAQVAAHLPPAALGVLIAGAYLRDGDALFHHEASYGTPLEAMERMGAAALAVALRPPPAEATSAEAHRTPMHRLAERTVKGLLSAKKTSTGEEGVRSAIRQALKRSHTWEMLHLLYCETRSTVFLTDDGDLDRDLTEMLEKIGTAYGMPYALEQSTATPLPCPLCAAEPLPVAGPHGPEHLYPCATMRCSSARCGYTITVEGLDTPKGREAVLQQAVLAWNRRPESTGGRHPPYASAAAGRFLVCPCCGHPDLAPDLRFIRAYAHEGRPVVSGFGPEGSVLLPVQTLRCVGNCPASVQQVCSEENTVQHLIDTWNSRGGGRYWPGFAPTRSPMEALVEAQHAARPAEEEPPPPQSEYLPCEDCGGAGEMQCPDCAGRFGGCSCCANCGATGVVVCHNCDGTGKVYEHDTSFRQG